MKLTSVLATAALAGTAMAGGGTNLLQNASFEEFNVLLGGFTGWETFNNVLPDPPDDFTDPEVVAADGVRSAKMFGNFAGVQNDAGAFQIVSTPNAGGKNFRATVSVQTPSSDPIGVNDPGDSNGDGVLGHLPLLLMQFRDANGEQLFQPEVTVFDGATDNADEWVTRSVESIAPNGTEEINIFCLFIQWAEDPGSLFWDNVVLEELQDGPDCTGLDNPDKLVDDSTAPWEGFMNVFNTDGSYAFGSGWAIPDLTASFDDNVPNVEMKPVGIDTADDFWYVLGVGGPGAVGNKDMEANLFQSTQTCLAGQNVTFSGFVQSNTLTEDYVAEIWIKDFTGNFSEFVETRIPADEGPFSISLGTIDDPTRVVQWGFSVFGRNVWPTDVDNFGSVIFSSVGVDLGCNAADNSEPFGVLDLNDITGFIAAFQGGQPAADIDDNGIFDLNDITEFITAFNAGCP